MLDTKDRILDAAERLFALHGFAATSLRAITNEAGVNLAAVNYHFHSKEALIGEVFSRRLKPVNARRLELLDAIEARNPQGPLSLEELLEALIGPVMEVAMASNVAPLIARMLLEPGDLAYRTLGQEMGEIVRRFGCAVRRALPGTPVDRLLWGALFTVGAASHTLIGHRLLQKFSGGRIPPSPPQEILGRLIAYTSAGLRAVAAYEAGKEIRV